MTRITVDRDPAYAPCSYLICKVGGDWDTRDDERTVLVQTDWDYPGLASTFGWSPCHDETDGTVDCPCGKTAGELIAEASQYLNEHCGEVVDDPGYFDGDN